jgi:hypothetical protein
MQKLKEIRTLLDLVNLLRFIMTAKKKALLELKFKLICWRSLESPSSTLQIKTITFSIAFVISSIKRPLIIMVLFFQVRINLKFKTITS